MDTLIAEGIQIMILGLGTVFIFLVVMIIMMGIVAKFIVLINKILPEPVEVKQEQKAVTSDNGASIAVAIAAAHFKK